MTHLVGLLALGFFLGMRHATDPDHVVAVTAIVSRERTARAALLLGALWGVGHTATILAVGGAIVIFGLVIPPRLGLTMEMSVAAMLVVLGVMNLTGALRSIHGAAHGLPDAMADPPSGSVRRFAGLTPRRAFRPLAVGVVHGLAGSAAIALLVLATIRNVAWAAIYLLTFGLGTILGMMTLTLAMGVPVAAAAGRSVSAERALVRLTGLVSLFFGLFLAYRIGIVDGLLTGAPKWTPE